MVKSVTAALTIHDGKVRYVIPLRTPNETDTCY